MKQPRIDATEFALTRIEQVRANRQQEVRDVLQQHAGDPQRWDLARAIERRYYKMIPKVDLQQLLRHIDHVAKVAGADHVGEVGAGRDERKASDRRG